MRPLAKVLLGVGLGVAVPLGLLIGVAAWVLRLRPDRAEVVVVNASDAVAAAGMFILESWVIPLSTTDFVAPGTTGTAAFAPGRRVDGVVLRIQVGDRLYQSDARVFRDDGDVTHRFVITANHSGVMVAYTTNGEARDLAVSPIDSVRPRSDDGYYRVATPSTSPSSNATSR